MEQNIQKENKNLPITIIGIGGCGGNVVNYISKKGGITADYIVCDSDEQALNRWKITNKLLMNSQNREEIVRKILDIQEDDTRNIIIIAGLGGEAVKLLTSIRRGSKRIHLLLVRPFAFEGEKRNRRAYSTLWLLEHMPFRNIKTFNNETMMQLHPDMELKEAFKLIDDQIHATVGQIVDKSASIVQEEKERKERFSQATYHEKIFVDQALKGNCDSVGPDSNPELYERQYILNDMFVFDYNNIERIGQVNQMLDKQTKRAYQEALKMEEYILNEMKCENSFITDYEIDFRVALCSEKKYSHFESMEGDPFFDFHPCLFNFRKKGHDSGSHFNWIFNTNHNEFGCLDNHPLEHQVHCALMHDLCDHTYLAWQDIVDIENIWIDIEVKIQNF